MPKLKVNGSWEQFVEPLKALEPFTTHGSLRGERMTGVASFGRLGCGYWEGVKDSDYVVYSYGTPIAWHLREGMLTHPGQSRWIMPEETYSVTTSKQQGRIRTALSQIKDISY